ncbi:MAG TPA: hypothetical protein VM261_00965 [Kofleriaceae bacterium]|nr:hypothetical protein [Kofleriaceae bacterium]
MRAAILVGALVLTASAGTALAYPQYQISKEQTCAACHVSPVGGGLLNDYGELTAEEESQWGGNPGFLHGVIELPEILRLGGDLRGAGGAHTRGDGLTSAIFPMQSELYAYVEKSNVGLYAIGGATIEGGAMDSRALVPFSREHWVTWKQGEGEGLYVRAGRFMPVQGLRQPEHVYYTRRFGGTPLFSEAYGANIGYLKPDLEAHVTLFVADPLIDSIERGDGGAMYVEKRLKEGTLAVGLLDRFTTSDTDTRFHGGVTGKYWMPDQKLLLSTELQVVRQNFKLDAPTRFQLVGNLFATYFVKPGLFVNLGLGHYDEDLSVAKVDRDAIDLNVHFFAISHLELILMNRYQMIGLGSGGDSSGYSMLQLHYRI